MRRTLWLALLAVALTVCSCNDETDQPAGTSGEDRPAGPAGTPPEQRLPRPAGPPPTEANAPLFPHLAARKPSPAGHILYTRSVLLAGGGAETGVHVSHVFIMAGDGKGQSPFIAPAGAVWVEQPCWCPDGRLVAFSSNHEMARSAYYMDVFLADLEAGTVRRVTGSEWSAGAVKGYGSLRVKVPVGDPRSETTYFGHMVDPLHRICISYNGGGTVHHLQCLAKDERGGDVQHRYEFVISGVPAGHIWVKAWLSKHIGALKASVVVQEGQETEVEMDMRSGNHLGYTPSVAPGGRYVACGHGIAYYRTPAAGATGSDAIPEAGYDTFGLWDAAACQYAVMWDAAKFHNLSAWQPRISPDGKWIAFTVGLTPIESIAVCPLERFLAGEYKVRVVAHGHRDLGASVGNTQAAWAPDSRRIAFIRQVQTVSAEALGFSGNVFVTDVEGAEPVQVTDVAGDSCPAWPSWSPDGSRIAFALMTNPAGRFEAVHLMGMGIRSDIWAIGADGSGPLRLTKDGLSREPAWGP